MLVVAFAALGGLVACSGSERLGGAQPEPPGAPPATASAPSPITPPPIDLAGRWRLTAAAGGACFMAFGASPGASQGTIAPEGGCPGNFFTSRKWAFERGMLILRDHKGEPLAQLSFVAGHFEGQDSGGGALTLSR